MDQALDVAIQRMKKNVSNVDNPQVYVRILLNIGITVDLGSGDF